MEPQLSHRITDSVATVVIRHPAKRNAMTAAMWRALPPLLERFASDPGVRALVLTGEGGTFCAGADITTLRESPQQAQQLSVAAEEALAAFPKPSLAAVRGHCVGGGAQLAAACDLRLAEEGAQFGVTPARLGLVYPASSTRRLASLVGPSAAKYLLFSAELIDAGRALRTGLVDEVLPEGELDKRVGDLTRILTARSQLTQAAAKEFANGRTDRDAHWAEQGRDNCDTMEGVAAFLERRQPHFTWSMTYPEGAGA
ncbi:enoyl-CoA hydratase/isomerase family protein [Streptomyces pluripotens]|uniref:Enoyl-CoA hydratase/isomerase family protein n=1 Tax=Streptomyces pluripotens TaxID=1355015 RepID=A0A221P5S9_9ACTN|nr:MULTISPECIES: enoyl-CoA hydratase/isomerase family protein [Streptomyces]ARP73263.1 enoyl-CoA hydratase [Streptomyces pluripotens]ASN27512.1 enoyl-CoA hydratase/isomerase family protein [Streptomyces pluripotens]KIE24451.1 enoyl-CoA hydratase [Streptomyces sp. MUSC 125]MCH0560528.1 enoyl-CoA hydratase/isomerase family protein [Streptomyces sp. MUM 16J]